MEQNFASLCYHYVRPEDNPFPKILGNEITEFQNHLKILKKNYSLVSPKDILNFYYDNYSFQNRKNILLTFDDGLSDHFEAAKILHEHEIQAIFFVPTCIIDDKLPANPMVIHYCIAEFGVEKFLNAYHKIIEELKLDNHQQFVIGYKREFDDVWKKINEIKTFFKYRIEHNLARKILLKIFDSLFLSQYPNAMNIIHLNENKIKKMIDMGHTIGTHTHTHVSVAATQLNSSDFEQEIIYPKKLLEKKFGINVFSFSYPFGEKQDCLLSSELLAKTNEYQIAFTVEEVMNTRKSSPLQLGRFSPHSSDTAEKLSLKIDKIMNN